MAEYGECLCAVRVVKIFNGFDVDDTSPIETTINIGVFEITSDNIHNGCIRYVHIE